MPKGKMLEKFLVLMNSFNVIDVELRKIHDILRNQVTKKNKNYIISKIGQFQVKH